jgi:hypothetical protein
LQIISAFFARDDVSLFNYSGHPMQKCSSKKVAPQHSEVHHSFKFRCSIHLLTHLLGFKRNYVGFCT